ncbi:MAG: extracellular solute-binding protein [Eubacteriales bacterium]|nr:extracellular solute-binding protein [Eubacteriales bacterium]
MTKKILSTLLALVLLMSCFSFAAAEEAPIEITFLTYDAQQTDSGMTRFEQAVEMYKEVKPNVTINIDVQAENSSTDFLTKLDLLQLTGVTGDIIQIPSFREYSVRAEQGFFYPIDEMIATEGVNYDDVYAYPTKIADKSYGIPFEPGIYGIFINKTMLDAAGLELPKEGWTWDDYRTYAEKMTTGTGADTIYGSFMHSWSEFKREGLFNVVMDNPYVKEDGTSNLDSKYFGDWLQYMYDLENVSKCQTPYSDVKATGLHYRDMFVTGKVAMIPIGTWMIDSVIDTTNYPHEFETVFAPFPVFEDGKAGVTQGAASYLCIGANSTPEKAQAAYDFIRWMSNEGSTALNIFPADKGGDFASVLTAKVGDKSNLMNIQSILDVWTSPNMVANIIGRDAALFTEIDAIYNSEAELFLLGSQDLATTLANIQEQGNAIIDAAK